MPDRMPEDMSEYMPEDLPHRMPEDLPDRMPEDMPDRMPENLPDRMPEDMPDRMPENLPDRMPEDMSNRMPEDLRVTKCVNVMVGITRSKVIYLKMAGLHCLGRFGAHAVSPKQPKAWMKLDVRTWPIYCLASTTTTVSARERWSFIVLQYVAKPMTYHPSSQPAIWYSKVRGTPSVMNRFVFLLVDFWVHLSTYISNPIPLILNTSVPLSHLCDLIPY